MMVFCCLSEATRATGSRWCLDCSAGTLNGAAMGREVIDFNADDATPTNTGQAILAIDVAAFGDAAEFKRSVDALARDIRGSKKMRGFERIWLPGEQSRLKFLERSRTGVPIAPTLINTLDELADRLKIEKLFIPAR